MNGSWNDRELENFMHNIAWLRRKHGLSKAKMAGLLGVGVPTLNKLERGELPPCLGVEIFFKLRDAFGVSVARQLTDRFGGQKDT